MNLDIINEELVLKYLEGKGYEILEKNFDENTSTNIIANHNDILTFIEVKTKDGVKYRYKNEIIDSKKKKEMANNSLKYLVDSNKVVRFDLIEVFPMEKDRIKHLENILSLY